MAIFANLQMPHLWARQGRREFLWLRDYRIVNLVWQHLVKPSDESHDESDCTQS